VYCYAECHYVECRGIGLAVALVVELLNDSNSGFYHFGKVAVRLVEFSDEKYLFASF